MSLGQYILVDKKVVACEDLRKWAIFMEKEDRIVEQETIMSSRNGINKEIWVSTVFLGLDHNFLRDGSLPIIFETMTFGKGTEYDQNVCLRCCTYEQALAQHQKVKDWLMGKTTSL